MPRNLKTALDNPIEKLEEISIAFTCTSTTKLSAAIRTLQGAQIGCLVVADAGTVVGIFTERDILTKITAKNVDLDVEVIGGYMTENPATVSRKTKISEAMRLMVRHNFRHLIVAEPGSSVIQIISMRDLCQYAISSMDLEASRGLWKKDVA